MKLHTMEQRTDEWHHVRKGKVTGTTLKSIMGTPKAYKEAMYTIIAERLTVGVQSDYENAMDRGNRLEPEAIAALEFETGLRTQTVGFCENDQNQHIGYSPDALILDDESEDVEVKCPGGKNYVKMWLENKVPDEYTWQLVQAFIVNPKLNKRYFVGYNPDIPTHPLHIIEVTREEIMEKINLAAKKQDIFLAEVEATLLTLIKL